jgi:hypothetical protein
MCQSSWLWQNMRYGSVWKLQLLELVM